MVVNDGWYKSLTIVAISGCLENHESCRLIEPDRIHVRASPKNRNCHFDRKTNNLGTSLPHIWKNKEQLMTQRDSPVIKFDSARRPPTHLPGKYTWILTQSMRQDQHRTTFLDSMTSKAGANTSQQMTKKTHHQDPTIETNHRNHQDPTSQINNLDHRNN